MNHSLANALIHLNEAEITRRLKQAVEKNFKDPLLEFPQLREFVSAEPKSAAVLIPLLSVDSSWHLLLTVRNANLPEHSGQVAFPGGRADPEDASPEDTALRETNEEIGVRPEDVRVLGRLRRYLTVTNYMVTPVVGVMPWPYPINPAAHEVSRVFTVPLTWLADPANHEERPHQVPGPRLPVPVIYFQPYEREVLWGASARFTLALLDALKLI